VTADPRLDTARTQAARYPWPIPAIHLCPDQGPVGGREPGTHLMDGRAPTANPTPGGR
jgi:hypothetical protein